VDDFDIAPNKIGESAQRVVDRAVEESRRRDHALLTNEHVFLASRRWSGTPSHRSCAISS
jgi:hypothetical protein